MEFLFSKKELRGLKDIPRRWSKKNQLITILYLVYFTSPTSIPKNHPTSNWVYLHPRDYHRKARIYRHRHKQVDGQNVGPVRLNSWWPNIRDQNSRFGRLETIFWLLGSMSRMPTIKTEDLVREKREHTFLTVSIGLFFSLINPDKT